MEINVYNASNKLESYAISAVEFAMAKFFDVKDLNKYISVDVDFTDLDVEGHCIDAGDGEFSIEIKKDLPMREKMIVLMHELVHMKQHIAGELEFGGIIIGKDGLKCKTTTWMGAEFDEEGTDYFDRPWEIEAFGRQLGLFIRWVESIGEGHHKKWQV
tara:strand:+ start:2905 stop:3378 length:474 start_codon:yes stop_codon:yes gene_type:complete